jgi:hypothetical protein
MGTVTLTLSEKAETYLRHKNSKLGDMGRLVSELLEQAADKEANVCSQRVRRLVQAGKEHEEA